VKRIGKLQIAVIFAQLLTDGVGQSRFPVSHSPRGSGSATGQRQIQTMHATRFRCGRPRFLEIC